MSEFMVHLRKDVKLLTSDSWFIVLLVALTAVSFFIALASCAAYVQNITWGDLVVTRASLEALQRSALVSYWSSIGNILMVIFLATSSMAMSVEKDSGMSKYILTQRVSKIRFYLSKLLLLIALVLFGLIVALIAYLIVFSFMDVPMLDLGSLMLSMLFPLLSMLVFTAMGLMIATLANKKGAVIAIAVVLFIALTAISQLSINLGAVAAMRDDPTLTNYNFTSGLPLEYQLLIYSNPVILIQGTSYALNVDNSYAPLFDTGQGVILAVLYFVVFTALGLLSFSRERLDVPWSTRLLSAVGRK
jgi:ABC-type transport system involved in multi-copper enzyme maturation permease subunit